MAKTIKGGKILLQLDDGNTIELFTGKTKKAKKAVDSLSKSEATLNRNFKGASQQSSNTTKNFSKMAQGITGGLVPAYATLAANIFAIGAAFRFLQSAADYRILIQGQQEYANLTGESLKLMTSRLQAATGAQLAFAEAAQSVAIARAAGLSSDQITRLGVVARTASIALGRDLTDSLNRLIRGTTKAEPELLDELGIILRLETAAENYGLKIGKLGKDLSIFEKSQAVVNEVLEQGETKFGDFNTELNEFSKLAKSFDDLLNKIKISLTGVAEFMAKAFTQNTAALAGAGALLTTGIVSAITPQAPQFDAGAAADSAREKLGGFYTGKRDINNLDSKGLDAMTRDIKRAYKTRSSTVIKFNQLSRNEALRTIDIIRINTLRAEAEKANVFKRTILNMRAEYATLRQTHGRTMAFMTTTARAAGRAMSTALRFAGYIGVILSLGGVLKQLYDTYIAGDDATEKFQDRQKQTLELLKEQNTEIARIQGNIVETTTLMDRFAQKAKIFANFSFMGVGTNFGDREDPKSYGSFQKLSRLTDPQKETVTETKTSLEKMLEELNPGEQFDEVQGIIDSLDKALVQSGSNVGITTEQFAALTKTLKDLEKNGTGAMKTMEKFGTVANTLNNSSLEYNKSLARLRPQQSQMAVGTKNMGLYGSALFDSGVKLAEGDLKIVKEFEKGVPEQIKTQLVQMIGKAAFDTIMKNTKTDATGPNALVIAQIKALGTAAIEEAQRLEKVEIRLLTEKDRLQQEFNRNNSREAAGLRKRRETMMKIKQIEEDIFKIEEERRMRMQSGAGPLKGVDAAVEENNMNKLKDKLFIAKEEINLLAQVEKTFRDSFETGMTTAIQGLIEGTTNLKDAFLSMTKSILSAIAQILAKQAAIAIMSVIPGMPGTGSREGGIMRAPGYRSYGTGGVADGPDSGYPATLHGTEAVVPLPNGRSIPVEMSGGAGANNVTVNVNMTSGESASTGTGEDAYELGRAISAAVSNEIEKQQRPGGTLSPY